MSSTKTQRSSLTQTSSITQASPDAHADASQRWTPRLWGILMVLITEGFVMILDGAADIRVSEFWGALPGT